MSCGADIDIIKAVHLSTTAFQLAMLAKNGSSGEKLFFQKFTPKILRSSQEEGQYGRFLSVDVLISQICASFDVGWAVFLWHKGFD